MSVLLCDSNGELWFDRVKKLGMDYISMPYTLENKEYFYDLGEKTDFRQFYDAVRKGKIPTTSALNPENYKDILEPYLAKGEDVLYVSFSHKMSGTFNQLEKAIAELKDKYPKRTIRVFDTKSISLGAGLQMQEAALLKQKGATDEEIINHLKDFTNKIGLYFVVDDLMHLKRGGRLSAASAFAGTLFGIKPLLTIDAEGGLSAIAKIGGKKKALNILAQKVTEQLADEDKEVYIVDADCPNDGDYVKELILQKRPNAKIVRQIVGPVIGSHCGPGTIGVIFVANQRPVPLKSTEENK